MARNRNIFADILGGQFLGDSRFTIKHWTLLTYIFTLVIISVSIIFRNKSLLSEKERNLKIIKELKTEAISKEAVLLDLCNQNQIKEILESKESKLRAPTNPPVIVKSTR